MKKPKLNFLYSAETKPRPHPWPLIFFFLHGDQPPPLLYLADSPSRALLPLAKPEKTLLWPWRIFGFPLQPAIDQ
jgi:hypothetical protein